MESIEFTEAEIQEELARLGYQNVPDEKLRDFKRDLRRLIETDKSKDTSHASSADHRDASMSSGSSRDPVLRERVTVKETQYSKQWKGPPTGYGMYGKENRFTSRYVGDFKSLPPGMTYTAGQYTLYDSPTETTSVGHELQDDVSLSEYGSEKRIVKRKVLRKNDKGSKFIDESLTESDAGSLSGANEGLQRLALRESQELGLSRPGSGLSRQPQSSRDYVPYRLSPDDPRPPSVILRPAEHPHSRNLKKCDPVSLFQRFKHVWDKQKAPGEKEHKGLRWNIREQMLAQDTFEKKPQKMFVPNTYRVPTDKKRQSLRWKIRTDMANGNMPACGSFNEL